jgi:hypothetical protein
VAVGASEDDAAVFEWLSESVEDIAGELGQLIEEKDAAVRERDLAGRQPGSPADERRVR